MGLSLTWLLLAALTGLELVLFQQVFLSFIWLVAALSPADHYSTTLLIHKWSPIQVFVNQLEDVINLQALESGVAGENTSPPGWKLEVTN